MLKHITKFIPYQYAVLLCVLLYSVLISFIILTAIAYFSLAEVSALLNYDALLQSLIALNSGILIAIFVALFYGSETNITILKKFKHASRQTIIVLLVNSFLVGISTLFAMNFPEGSQPDVNDYLIRANIVASSVALVATVANALEVFQLVKISLRKDNSDKLPKNQNM